MSQTIKSFIRDQFRLSNNNVMRVIIINTICALFFVISKLIFNLIGMETIYSKIEHFLFLSTNWKTLCLRPWTIFSYSVIEYNLFSLFWSILFLRFFGKIINSYLGDKHFFKIYLLSIIASGLFVVAFYTFLPKFTDQTSYLIGLQGAVYGILTTATIIAPNLHINVFIFPIQLKYIFIFFVLQAIYKLDEGNTIGIAQIGGAAFAYCYMKSLNFFNFSCAELFNKIFKKTKNTKNVNINLDKEQKENSIDEILEKIARFGYSSLSLEEKKKIFKKNNE